MKKCKNCNQNIVRPSGRAAAKKSLSYNLKHNISDIDIENQNNQAIEKAMMKTFQPKKEKPEIIDNLYLIHDTILNTVKIGRSKNVKKRLQTLQLSTSNKLILLFEVKDKGCLELSLHNSYKSFRLASEWFTYNQTIIDNFKNISDVGL